MQQSLCDLAIVPAFREPVLESVAIQFRHILRLIHVTEVQAVRHGIIWKQFFQLTSGPPIEVLIKFVHGFFTMCGTPMATPREKRQKTLQQSPPDTQVFYIFIILAIATPQNDEMVVQVRGPPWKHDALANLLEGDFSLFRLTIELDHEPGLREISDAGSPHHLIHIDVDDVVD